MNKGNVRVNLFLTNESEIRVSPILSQGEGAPFVNVDLGDSYSSSITLYIYTKEQAERLIVCAQSARNFLLAQEELSKETPR